MFVCDSVSVALQFPEGLLLFACIIVDILERFLMFLLHDVFNVVATLLCNILLFAVFVYAKCQIFHIGAQSSVDIKFSIVYRII